MFVLVKLMNVAYLNICHGNCDLVARVLQQEDVKYLNTINLGNWGLHGSNIDKLNFWSNDTLVKINPNRMIEILATGIVIYSIFQVNLWLVYLFCERSIVFATNSSVGYRDTSWIRKEISRKNTRHCTCNIFFYSGIIGRTWYKSLLFTLSSWEPLISNPKSIILQGNARCEAKEKLDSLTLRLFIYEINKTLRPLLDSVLAIIFLYIYDSFSVFVAVSLSLSFSLSPYLSNSVCVVSSLSTA